MSIIRDITTQAKKYLENNDILLFVGARQAGKTTILKQIQSYLENKNQTIHFLNLEDPDYLGLLNKSPKNLFKIFTIDLKKKTFLIIDEIQYLDNPTNFLKYFWDEYKEKIKIIASGSSAFYIDKKFKDSLVGRKKIFNVKTLSFREFLRFKNENELSLKDFDKISLSEKEKISISYQEYLVYGGYPRVVLSPVDEKEEVLRDIAYSYVKKDIYEANIKQDEIFYKLFKILASQTGNLINASKMANTLDVSKSSIDNYLYIMQKSFHINLIKPFFKNIRKELTKMPKIYFSDLGLRNFFISNFNTPETREDKGALLENAVFRQLREKYPKDKIKFWRTIDQNEIDFVVEEKKSFEVKINPRRIKEISYKKFFKNYPDIQFSVVSLNIKNDLKTQYKTIEAWQV